MAKWKCEICGNEFDNFHAQGFDNRIYCPLCYFKKENQELKKQLEETNEMIKKCGFVNIEQVMLSYCGLITQQKEFINYLEDEKNRLARECSHIYEDSLGHTRLVNEDIFDEVNDILQKYKSIIGVSDEFKK